MIDHLAKLPLDTQGRYKGWAIEKDVRSRRYALEKEGVVIYVCMDSLDDSPSPYETLDMYIEDYDQFGYRDPEDYLSSRSYVPLGSGITNCHNCAAPIVGSACQHCGTHYRI